MSKKSMAKISVAVIFGGRSSEHSVSCVTATNVVKFLLEAGYDVYPVGITQTGQWTYMKAEDVNFAFPESGSAESGSAEVSDSEQYVQGSAWSVHPPMDTESHDWHLSNGADVKNFATIDVVFPLLHGPYGEDGTIQGLLELAGIPYVGSGVLASAACMEKHTTKVLLAAAGFEVSPWVFISDRNWNTRKEELLEECRALDLPLFVKPSRAGSSMGVVKVKDYAELETAIESAREHDKLVLVEQGIVGREIECSVLDDTPVPRASKPAEIVMADNVEFYDFETKYLDADGARVECPADIPAQDMATMRELAVKAFNVLELESLARVDFFYTAEGQFIVNEINTMPGFTPISGFPLMWQKMGMSYGELLTYLVEHAFERSRGLR